MSADDNKETVRRLYDVFARGNLDETDRYISSDVMDHNASPGQRSGMEGIRDVIREYRSAFSDLRPEIHHQIAEGDTVVSHITIHGRHTGEFQGIPPTGKEIAYRFVDIVKLSGGKITERWGVEDSLGLLTQLGALPGLGESGRRAA